MEKKKCAFCGNKTVEITEQGDTCCYSCNAVQLDMGEENNPFTMVNCPKCGYRHQILTKIIFYGDPTICNKCRQTSYKWSTSKILM